MSKIKRKAREEKLSYGKWNKKVIEDFRNRFGLEDSDNPIIVSTPKTAGIKLYSTIEWGHPQHWDIQPDTDRTQELINWINRNFNLKYE